MLEVTSEEDLEAERVFAESDEHERIAEEKREAHFASLSEEQRQEILKFERQGDYELHDSIRQNWFNWTHQQRKEEIYSSLQTSDKFQDGFYDSRPPQAEIIMAKMFPEDRVYYIKEYRDYIEGLRDVDPHDWLAKDMQKLLDDLLKDG